MSEPLIRPMTVDDVPTAQRLSDEGFLALERRTRRPDQPEPIGRGAARREQWAAQTRHLVATDPGGCWVAESEGAMVGFVTSFVRETTWFLATFAVRPHLQGQGLGRHLLAAGLHHGRGTLHGMLAALSDPKAVRRYRSAGFMLHPQMHLRGVVDRTSIPVVEKVREGSAADVELMDSLDRRIRGAAHGVDHQVMLEHERLLISDTTTGSGYAYICPERGVTLLAASNRRTATRLLWAGLADGGEDGAPQTIAHVTAANEWAIDVGLAARMDLHQDGYLGLRGLTPPTPYLHHGALL